METLAQLAALTDAEANQCLNRILSSFKETNPEIPITSPGDLNNILQSLATEADERIVAPSSDKGLRDRAKATRLILLEFAGEPALQPRLHAALGDTRQTLFEPVTTALIAAGIVVLLSTKGDISYERDKDGKSKFKIAIHKKSSSEALIKKVLSIFG